MKVEKVEIIDGTTVLNGEYSVPDDPRNRHRALINAWIAEGNSPTIITTPITESPEEKNARLMLEGIEFNGVMCSATQDDLTNLYMLKDQVVYNKISFNFQFANGNKLWITPDNIAKFEKVWLPFRMSFFEFTVGGK